MTSRRALGASTILQTHQTSMGVNEREEGVLPRNAATLTLT